MLLDRIYELVNSVRDEVSVLFLLHLRPRDISRGFMWRVVAAELMVISAGRCLMDRRVRWVGRQRGRGCVNCRNMKGWWGTVEGCMFDVG